MTLRLFFPAAMTLLAMSLGCGGSADAASPWVKKGVDAADNLLPAAQAFQLLSAQRSGDRIAVTWAIAPGYYLYRKRLGFDVVTPAAGTTIDTPALPNGLTVADEQGTTEVYRETLVAQLHISGTTPPKQLRVRYQGCADAGVCYPPVTAVVDIQTATP